MPSSRSWLYHIRSCVPLELSVLSNRRCHVGYLTPRRTVPLVVPPVSTLYSTSDIGYLCVMDSVFAMVNSEEWRHTHQIRKCTRLATSHGSATTTAKTSKTIFKLNQRWTTLKNTYRGLVSTFPPRCRRKARAPARILETSRGGTSNDTGGSLAGRSYRARLRPRVPRGSSTAGSDRRPGFYRWIRSGGVAPGSVGKAWD